MAGRRKIVRGGEIPGLKPDWRPLLDLAPDEIPEFMWMFRVELEGGRVVEAYKHSWTRQYLYLDSQGRAYLFLGRGRWEEADARSVLKDALAGCQSRANIVRRNDWVSGERITWARSATRHRVARARTLFVIQHAGACFSGELGRRGEPSVYFFGDDKDEARLEVVGFENDDGDLHVVHSMPLRESFEKEYTEALRWRK